MIIKKRIKIPLYFQNLYIIQTDDFETIHREYKLKGSVDFAGVTILDDDEIVVVSEYDRDNDETLAYLLGWVVEQIHKTIKVNGK